MVAYRSLVGFETRVSVLSRSSSLARTRDGHIQAAAQLQASLKVSQIGWF